MNANKSLVSLASEEIKEGVGEYNFTLIMEEDKETFSLFKNPFIIALKCTLKQGKKVLGIGRANSVLSPRNKFIKSAFLFCWNAALTDGISKAVKILDNLPLKANEPSVEKKENIEEPDLEGRDRQAYFTNEDNLKYASDKQRNFLKKLVSKCKDSTQKEYESKLESPYLSSFEASQIISSLLKK